VACALAIEASAECSLGPDRHPVDSTAVSSHTLGQYRLGSGDLQAGPIFKFAEWPNDQVPRRAAGIYTMWRAPS